MSLVVPNENFVMNRGHRRVQSVAPTTGAPAFARLARPASADGPRDITTPAFVPAPLTSSPKSPFQLGDLNPTCFKRVLAGYQRRPSSSSCSYTKEPTLGSLRRQCGTRSLGAIAANSQQQDSNFTIKRRGAARNLLCMAREECGFPEPPRKASPVPFRISRFLDGEPTFV